MTKLLRIISSLPGWRTKRKIVVFESDDWGSVRMSSVKAFESLKARGLNLESRYNHYDTLASKEDLSSLFEVLSSVKDKNEAYAVFTAVSLVANPDFEKIKNSSFQEYHYEPFTATLKRYNRDDAFLCWQEGMMKRLFVPQFHGREHLNVQVWLRALQSGDKHSHMAFEEEVWGFNRQPMGYQAAFDVDFPQDIVYQKTVIDEGLQLFEQLHGYKATFFVPPNGPFNSELEAATSYGGIKYISTAKIHREPRGNNQYKTKFYWLGRKNRHGQCFITRNASFEPSVNNKDWVDNCLKDISMAFKYLKPATISTHRVNYTGSLHPSNRDRGLRDLKSLLDQIVKTWPEVEFMTASELGDLISNK